MDDVGGSLVVEVAAAWPQRQVVVSVTLEPGATIADAIKASGLAERFPELEIGPERIGIFGSPRSPDHCLADGDRVEIYRPLKVDPREARRLAAEKQDCAGIEGESGSGW